MRYGYDLNNPKEREMYFEKRIREMKRQINNTDINKGFKEIIEENQKEIQYFRERENNEKELNEQVKEEIEDKLQEIIVKELTEIIK